MKEPTPERREALLRLAEGLSQRLQTAPVPYVHSSAQAGTGLPQSTVAHATGFLARERDKSRFLEFLGSLDQLDEIAAQNPDNPKADHRVLADELRAFLEQHEDLDSEELLYVLAWVRRLLPKRAGTNGRQRTDRNDPPNSAEPSHDFRGGQLGAALKRMDVGPGKGSKTSRAGGRKRK